MNYKSLIVLVILILVYQTISIAQTTKRKSLDTLGAYKIVLDKSG